MLNSCFAWANPVTIIVLAIVFTIIAIYLVLVSHQTDQSGKYIAIGFALLTLISLLLFYCWAFLIALIELIIGFLMNREKLKILRLS